MITLGWVVTPSFLILCSESTSDLFFFTCIHSDSSLFSRTLDRYGAGAGGTRNIAGNGTVHLALEEELANLHRKEAALVFSSCYVANDSTLSTLGSKLPGCVFFSDSLNHASMINGMRHSRAKREIWKHNDMADLEAKLKMYPRSTPKIIAFESVYSMCGSVAPINAICDLAEKYGAITFNDEVGWIDQNCYVTSLLM